MRSRDFGNLRWVIASNRGEVTAGPISIVTVAAPNRPDPYIADKRGYLYLARDHVRNGRQIVKIGTTNKTLMDRLKTLRGGISRRANIDRSQRPNQVCVTNFYGSADDWVIERAWQVDSARALQEAEKLAIAIALGYPGTLPLGSDYIRHIRIKDAEQAVERAIRRIKGYAERKHGHRIHCHSFRRTNIGRDGAQDSSWAVPITRAPIYLKSCGEAD